MAVIISRVTTPLKLLGFGAVSEDVSTLPKLLPLSSNLPKEYACVALFDVAYPQVKSIEDFLHLHLHLL